MTVVADQNQITDVVEPVIIGLGFELVAVQVARAGRRHVVRVLADRPGGGIGLSDCAQISRALSAALDDVPGTDGPYTLEVSSPGLDWHCEKLSDFVRYQGQSMTIHLADGGTFSGILTEATEEQLVFETGDIVPRKQVKYGTRNY
jgi:ribosome maturation factor RimP